MSQQNFVIEQLPTDAYQELGRAEMEYTRQQMSVGKLTQLLVTNDHRKYWMVWAVADEAELKSSMEGFPLHAYFDYTVRPVMDMVAATAAANPNLD